MVTQAAEVEPLKANGAERQQRPSSTNNQRWASLLDRLHLFNNNNNDDDASAAVVRNELVRAQSSSNRLLKSPSCSAFGVIDEDEDQGKPQRWVDFFCIVGLDKEEEQVQQPTTTTEERLNNKIQPRLLDSFPKPTTSSPLQVPEHLPTFCFPHGYHVIRVAQRKPESAVQPKLPEPGLHTIVLTLSNGHRLYGTILTVYDQLLLAETAADAEEPVPKRAKTTSTTTDDANNNNNDDLLFLPKCYVLLSHYPFFHAQSTILQELYCTVRSGTSPLPFERYVAHVVLDISFPRPLRSGCLHWQSWRRSSSTAATAATVVLERPAPNALPLCNVSFEPLFRTLSLANVLVVWATLLQEGKVVVTCSERCVALLTPLCEALLAVLFPLTWQGMYIPVLPSQGSSSCCMDILEAPIPYLVGMTIDDTTQFRPPVGVVWCNLDSDIVHLGWKDDGSTVQATLPDVPDAASLRLLHELEPLADPWYLPPPSGLKGRITMGHPSSGSYLENIARHPYAQMTQQRPTLSRAYILSQASKLPPQQRRRRRQGTEAMDVSEQHQHQEYRFFPSSTTTTATGANDGQDDDQPTLSNHENNPVGDLLDTNSTSSLYTSLVHQHRVVQAHADRLFSVLGQNFATPSPYQPGTGITDGGGDLLEQQDAMTQRFYGPDTTAVSSAIRTAFLRFFLRVLAGYSQYVDPTTQRMDNDRFVKSLPMSHKNQLYVRSIVENQMFALFLQQPHASRRKLFDEMVLQKQQQKRFNNSAIRRPFLDAWKDPPTVVVPSLPCTRGIPHFGKRVFDRTFPDHLDPKECVTDSTYSSFGSFCSVFMACTG